AKLQLSPYYCSQNINKLTPKFKFNKSVMYFFVTIIQKFIAKYDGQQGGYKLDELKNHIAQIPTLKNGELAFEFMEIFIKAVLKEVIKNVVLYSQKYTNTTRQVVEKG
ncbi:restriction endonuclease subunit S, partial [Campylobacter troglodytis]|uniref:restriction endonuclease subunit S n=1 Tax=Campylobacter troglodytis TaxID=654363 RepID=UPI00163CA63D